jgi:hypothetical protein
MSPEEQVKYLGLQFNWKGKIHVKHTGTVDGMLVNLQKAPLKPQQRLEILRTFLIPKLTYQLVLGSAHVNTLKRLDLMIRERLRHWTGLPKDTNTNYFYASMQDGGLGVPSLHATVPLYQRARFGKLLTTNNQISLAVKNSNSFAVQLRASNLPLKLNGEIVLSKADCRTAFKDGLASSCDGKEIAGCDGDPQSNGWLRNPEGVAPRLWRRAVQLRAGTLNTKVRMARRRQMRTTDVNCRAHCGCPESLNHILQKCAATHDIRCERHNRVMKAAAKKLRPQVDELYCEPTVPVDATFRKPDLVVRKGNVVSVIDVTISSSSRMEDNWKVKVDKYSTDECERSIKALFRATDRESLMICHTPLVISNRGLVYAKSAAALRRLHLKAYDISDFALLTIRGSLACYDVYMRGIT